MARHLVTDLRRLLGPDLVEAISQLVDERVTAVLSEHEQNQNGDRRAWLSMRDAAAELGVDPRTLRRLVERGRIRTTSLGRRRLVPREDIDRLLSEQLK
jgi:excisionase family DNA binding protein